MRVSKRVRVLSAAAIAITLALGAIWMVQASRDETDGAGGPRLTGNNGSSEAKEPSGSAETTASSSPTSSTLGGPSPKKPSQPAGRTREFAFILGLSSGSGSPSAQVDFAQFLTGDDAARAAAAAGEESPPPNDYFIVNDEQQPRSVDVSPDTEVLLYTRPGEGYAEGGYRSDFGDLTRYISEDREEWASFKANGYWLTIENGTVIRIEEQYAP